MYELVKQIMCDYLININMCIYEQQIQEYQTDQSHYCCKALEEETFAFHLDEYSVSQNLPYCVSVIIINELLHLMDI